MYLDAELMLFTYQLQETLSTTSRTSGFIHTFTLSLSCLCTGAADSMHSRGGLHTLISMVLGGLVAATPHMVAATVMALARMLYDFAGPLEYMMEKLLPAVLALLRTKSREVVKAVLGFVKVACWDSTSGTIYTCHASMAILCWMLLFW